VEKNELVGGGGSRCSYKRLGFVKLTWGSWWFEWDSMIDRGGTPNWIKGGGVWVG
jgi:hypothetical protein